MFRHLNKVIFCSILFPHFIANAQTANELVDNQKYFGVSGGGGIKSSSDQGSGGPSDFESGSFHFHLSSQWDIFVGGGTSSATTITGNQREQFSRSILLPGTYTSGFISNRYEFSEPTSDITTRSFGFSFNASLGNVTWNDTSVNLVTSCEPIEASARLFWDVKGRTADNKNSFILSLEAGLTNRFLADVPPDSMLRHFLGPTGALGAGSGIFWGWDVGFLASVNDFTIICRVYQIGLDEPRSDYAIRKVQASIEVRASGLFTKFPL